MEKLFNFIKKYWKILLVIAVLIHAYLLNLDWHNKFKGKLVADWLGYAGSWIGAVVSIFGIYWTLQDNRKQLEE